MSYTSAIYFSSTDFSNTEWDAAVPNHRFFLKSHYLKTLEKACHQFKPIYWTYSYNGKIIGVAYFQLVPFSGKSILPYLCDKEMNSITRIIASFILGLISVKIVALGNLFITGEKGCFLSENYDKISFFNQMYADLKNIPYSYQGVLLSKFNEGEFLQNEALQRGFYPFNTEDEMHIEIPNNWNSFSDYENALSSKYRVRYKKIIEKSVDFEIRRISPNDFETHQKEIEQLFQNVLKHVRFKLLEPTSVYFATFLKELDNFYLDGYFLDNKLVGFISYFELEKALDVHYIGLDYSVNTSHKLYNKILYDMLQKGIEQKKQMVWYSRTAQEIKSTVGAIPEQIVSYAKARNSMINKCLPFFLNRAKPEAYVLRNPFKK